MARTRRRLFLTRRFVGPLPPGLAGSRKVSDDPYTPGGDNTAGDKGIRCTRGGGCVRASSGRVLRVFWTLCYERRHRGRQPEA